MKQSERLISCPVCHKMVSEQYLPSHIGQMARYEKKEFLSVNAKHYLYKLSHIGQPKNETNPPIGQQNSSTI